jgi:P27 family predicted phage terminase small subunit
MKKSTVNPPTRLSREARVIWQKVLDAWQMDSAGMEILSVGLEAFDRMRQAQRILKRDGIVTKDRFGQMKAHPATLIERDSRAAMLKSFASLHLDIEPLQDGPGRPPGGG